MVDSVPVCVLPAVRLASRSDMMVTRSSGFDLMRVVAIPSWTCKDGTSPDPNESDTLFRDAWDKSAGDTPLDLDFTLGTPTAPAVSVGIMLLPYTHLDSQVVIAVSMGCTFFRVPPPAVPVASRSASRIIWLSDFALRSLRATPSMVSVVVMSSLPRVVRSVVPFME